MIVMGDDIKQEELASAVPEKGKEFAGRRKVIKGLAATVPVIMTITSGEAAATTSMLQCIGTPNGHNAPKWLKKGKSDQWVRKTAYYGRNRWGKKIYKQRLVYANKWGQIVHPNYYGAKPFTHSCYNSFLPKN